MSDKALGMLKHMRRQIFGHPAPYVEVRGAAVSIGADPWRERMRWPSR
jgi:hypothetical protein